MAQDGDPSSTEMAEARTDWAEDRTILAMERTFAGWMRTGMACVALGLGLRAVFGEVEGLPYARAAALGFCALAIFIFWSARNKSCKTLERLSHHAANPQKTANMTIIATVLSAGAVCVGGILLWL